MRISLSPRQAGLIILSTLLVFYILFQARFVILGPRVWIDSPLDGAVVTESVVTLSGRASNAAWISLNGTQIYTDQEGLWSEKLPLSRGTSIMTVSVKDRFGQKAEKSIHIILN